MTRDISIHCEECNSDKCYHVTNMYKIWDEMND